MLFETYIIYNAVISVQGALVSQQIILYRIVRDGIPGQNCLIKSTNEPMYTIWCTSSKVYTSRICIGGGVGVAN